MSETSLSQAVAEYAYPQREEAREEAKRKQERALGIRCKYCDARSTRVRATYPGGRRKRFCLRCRREFMTRESAAGEPGNPREDER